MGMDLETFWLINTLGKDSFCCQEGYCQKPAAPSGGKYCTKCMRIFWSELVFRAGCTLCEDEADEADEVNEVDEADETDESDDIDSLKRSFRYTCKRTVVQCFIANHPVAVAGGVVSDGMRNVAAPFRDVDMFTVPAPMVSYAARVQSLMCSMARLISPTASVMYESVSGRYSSPGVVQHFLSDGTLEAWRRCESEIVNSFIPLPSFDIPPNEIVAFFKQIEHAREQFLQIHTGDAMSTAFFSRQIKQVFRCPVCWNGHVFLRVEIIFVRSVTAEQYLEQASQLSLFKSVYLKTERDLGMCAISHGSLRLMHTMLMKLGQWALCTDIVSRFDFSACKLFYWTDAPSKKDPFPATMVGSHAISCLVDALKKQCRICPNFIKASARAYGKVSYRPLRLLKYIRDKKYNFNPRLASTGKYPQEDIGGYLLLRYCLEKGQDVFGNERVLCGSMGVGHVCEHIRHSRAFSGVQQPPGEYSCRIHGQESLHQF
tara:strand:+ start:773 stop:2233 length:1461 start_codon:yes stop_codon:yes gene_type:complete